MTSGTRTPEECEELANRQRKGEDLGFTDAFVRQWATAAGGAAKPAPKAEPPKAEAAPAKAEPAKAEPAPAKAEPAKAEPAPAKEG